MTEVHCGNVTGHLKPYKQFKNCCAFSSSCDAFGSSEEADLWWWWWSCLFPLFMRLDVAKVLSVLGPGRGYNSVSLSLHHSHPCLIYEVNMRHIQD